jgi:hypothetical protein
LTHNHENTFKQILHYKWIYPTTATAENHDDNTDEEYVFVFLHGLFGQGKNLSTFAQKLLHEMVYPTTKKKDSMELRKGIKCSGILIDLHGHGQSSLKISMNSMTNDGKNQIYDIKDILSSTLDSTLHHCLVEHEAKKIRHPQSQDRSSSTGTTTFTQAQNTSKFILIGHSLGGRVALHYCAQALLQVQLAPASNIQPQADRPVHHTQPKDPTSTENGTTTVQSPLLLPQHIWLLDTVPHKPDNTVMQVVKAIESILNERNDDNDAFQQPNGNETDSTGIKEKSDLSRHDIRQKIMTFDHNIPTGIVEWIASQWLIQEQRFLFDFNVVRHIVYDYLLEEKEVDDDDDLCATQQLKDDGGPLDTESTIRREQPMPMRYLNLTFWEQLEVILQQSSHIQVHILQADRNPAWNNSAVQEPLQAALHHDAKISYPNPHSRLTHHILADSGHWVHVDNLSGLIDIITSVTLES